MRKLLLLLVLSVWTVSNAFAGSVSGKVAAKETGEALPGANIYLQGTSVGAASDVDGMYYIKVNDGTYTIVCDYVGYATEKFDIKVSGDVQQNFDLTEYLFAKTIEVVADRAKERETPVAFTNVEKQKMEVTLGSRDIPLVLDTTPSVYATMQGGGAGDARINIRGFNQRNVAIMINGVPVNDMENGWVYWSNWDGVGDATSSIQVQRGLSAVNLATPSIGGTMNILTDPTAQSAGIKYKQEFGNDGFLKSTLIANSGLIDGKYAVTGGIVRKTGDGLIDKTWTDAWAYYFGASYNINPNNRLELYGMGAPQRHGQNSYKQNIGVYSEDFAKDLDDYDEAAFEDYFEVGREYNENWNKVSSSYKGKQYWNGSTHDRYDENFINERENYYHKPIVNLNWYTQLSKKLSLYSIAYYSGGAGGGSGYLGSMVWDYSNPSRIIDWDRTIARNDTQTTGSRGILRNSVNEQWTIGAISKAYYKVNDNLKTSFGIDWRTAEIEHFREVRDLLGGDYYYDDNNDFWTEA
ncbi:MAG: carboxypeptidase-like regulatory domain-containing protein, partial [Calditrichaceae bacterium]